MERNRAVRTSLIAVAVVGAAAGAWGMTHAGARDVTTPVTLPEGTQVVAEVLNGTDIDGLARRVTRWLRRRGVDVVYYGTVRDSLVHQTQLIVRRGDSTSGVSVRDVMGIGRVMDQPAERLLLDITIVLGIDAAGLGGLDP